MAAAEVVSCKDLKGSQYRYLDTNNSDGSSSWLHKLGCIKNSWPQIDAQKVTVPEVVTAYQAGSAKMCFVDLLASG